MTLEDNLLFEHLRASARKAGACSPIRRCCLGSAITQHITNKLLFLPYHSVIVEYVNMNL